MLIVTFYPCFNGLHTLGGISRVAPTLSIQEFFWVTFTPVIASLVVTGFATALESVYCVWVFIEIAIVFCLMARRTILYQFVMPA